MGDFVFALHNLRAGNNIHRINWNGHGQFVYYVPATEKLGAFFAIHPTVGPDRPWVPSISDLLADDWIVSCQLDNGGHYRVINDYAKGVYV